MGALFLLVNTLALSIAIPRVTLSVWLSLAGWIGCALVGNALLIHWLPSHDRFLFPLTMILTGWSLIIIARVAPEFAERQTLWMVIAVILMLATSLIPQILQWLRGYRYTLLMMGLIFLVATILFGSHPSGVAGAPALWLNIANFYFQPSEPLKIVLVAFLASYLAEQYAVLRADQQSFGVFPSPRMFGPVLLMWGLSMVVLVWQRDLGTAALFFLVFLILLYTASGQFAILVGGSLLAIVGGIAAYLLFAVVRLRVDTWLNPWLEADGRAYQVVQSLMAFAAGGITGSGVGQGSPTYIPVVHSDFIFAALAEEWGLIGVITVLILLGVIGARGLRASVSLRPFQALLTIGLSSLLIIQSFLIIGGVLKLIPLTGVTLPFMSYGGSSLVTNFIIIGLLLRVSSQGENPRAVSARS